MNFSLPDPSIPSPILSPFQFHPPLLVPSTASPPPNGGGDGRDGKRKTASRTKTAKTKTEPKLHLGRFSHFGFAELTAVTDR